MRISRFLPSVSETVSQALVAVREAGAVSGTAAAVPLRTGAAAGLGRLSMVILQGP